MIAERVRQLEEAVYNQGRANSLFEDIRDKISFIESIRKVENEQLRNRMDNVERAVKDQNFTLEHNTTYLDTIVKNKKFNVYRIKRLTS